MTTTSATNYDLFLVGAGVSFPAHLTCQTLEILSQCDHICTNIPEEYLTLLPKDLQAKCESLWPLYIEDRNRTENYVDVAKAVVNAVERIRPTAWMTPGHPIIADSVSQLLLKAGRDRGWNTLVVPGISCFDTILAEVQYDPAGGLLVHEATSAVKHNVSLTPALTTLLLQPSAFGSDNTHYRGNWQPDLLPLRDYLLQFYLPEYECAFVRSSPEAGKEPNIVWKKLGELHQISFADLVGSTLYLPEADFGVRSQSIFRLP